MNLYPQRRHDAFGEPQYLRYMNLSSNFNPAVYFEIPVSDIDRAIEFYGAVLDLTFTRTVIDHYEMALFPFDERLPGISGALSKGDVYRPTHEGVILYMRTADIRDTLQRVTANGGRIVLEITSATEWGCVAEFEDSEGNRVGLFEPNGD
jgi:predicted enzyme related to lactoylglutathione lyase